VVSLLFSNYLLWPVTNHILRTFVPKEHRTGATHVVTVRSACCRPRPCLRYCCAWIALLQAPGLLRTVCNALVLSSLATEGDI